MENRYQKIFSLPDDYPADCPAVSVAAGVLLYDTKTERIVAQIKYENISGKCIRSMAVSLTAYDMSGNHIKGVSNFQYDNLQASPGESFGDRIAIPLPDNNAHSFSIEFIRVDFSDGSSWSRFGDNLSAGVKVVGNAAKKTTLTAGKVLALLLNIAITVVILIATYYAIASFTPDRKSVCGIIALILATVISIPGIGKLIFRENYGIKQRIARWVVFSVIILADLLLVWVIL